MQPDTTVVLTAMIARDDPTLLKFWNLRTLRDAYAPRPPLEYLVAGLIPAGSLSIVYGAPGTLKSMLLADMCICIATGQPWLEPLPGTPGRPFTTIAAPVLWLDFDNGTRRTDERFDAIARARQVPEDAPIYYVSMPNPWLDASNTANTEAVGELIEHLGARLVIIDNLGLVTGDSDENSGDMTDVMSNLRRMAEAHNCAVIVVHHQRKSNGTLGRKGDSLRGHSSIESALDLALQVERDDASQTDLITLTATKVRGPDIIPFGAIFTYEHREGTSELGGARFWLHVLEDLQSDRAIDKAILEELAAGAPMTKTTLTEAVKKELPDVGVNRIRSRIDVLATAGKLMQTDGNRTTKLYAIANLKS